MLEGSANGDSAVADDLSEFGVVRDLVGDDALQFVDVSPLGVAGVEQDGEGGTGLDGVEANVVAEAIELCDVLPAIDGDVGAEEGESLELEARGEVVAVLVVDDVAALDDAAAEAGVHLAATLIEALHDATAGEVFDVGRLALGAVLVDEGVEHVRDIDERSGATFEAARAIEVTR